MLRKTPAHAKSVAPDPGPNMAKRLMSAEVSRVASGRREESADKCHDDDAHDERCRHGEAGRHGPSHFARETHAPIQR